MCCDLRECLHLHKMTCDKCDLPWHASMVKPSRVNFLLYYCWWKKSCTTWDVKNLVNNWKFTISIGAGFLPSTVPVCLLYEKGSIIVFACFLSSENNSSSESSKIFPAQSDCLEAIKILNTYFIFNIFYISYIVCIIVYKLYGYVLQYIDDIPSAKSSPMDHSHA